MSVLTKTEKNQVKGFVRLLFTLSVLAGVSVGFHDGSVLNGLLVALAAVFADFLIFAVILVSFAVHENLGK